MLKHQKFVLTLVVATAPLVTSVTPYLTTALVSTNHNETLLLDA